MGHFDTITVEPQVALTSTTTKATKYIDLPEAGLLSALHVDVGAVCFFSTSPGLDIWNIFTKFEVLVNGSQVVKSLDMKQARALAHYHGLDLSTLGWYGRHDTSGDKTYWTVPLLFGRHPYDKEYMLDLSAYSNPQLRITFDATPTTVDGETYYASSSPYIRYGVGGILYRGAPPEIKGYVKSSEIDKGPFGSAGAERTVEIPKGHDLLGLMQGARYTDDKLIDYIEEMEINFDNGAWKPIDHGYQELKALNALWYPRPVNIRVRKDNINDKPLDLCVGVCNSFQAWMSNEVVSNVYLAHEGTWNIQDLVMYTTGATAHTTAVSCDFAISGQFPHQFMYIPMNRYAEEGMIGIDTTKYGRIDMATKSGTSASTTPNLETVAEYILPTGA